MSRVLLASERTLRRQVVIKVLAPELARGVSADRFRLEIQVAASLDHPHIVPLLTEGEAAGHLYYTMPSVEGESLRERLAREHAKALDQLESLLKMPYLLSPGWLRIDPTFAPLIYKAVCLRRPA